MTERKNLVLLRSGAKSLHPKWLDSTENRSFDIACVSYQESADKIYPVDTQDSYAYYPGSKWEGISQWCRDNEETINQYEYFWLPDDDIITCYSDINRLFELCKVLDLKLAQPSLSKESYYSHIITKKHPSFYLRWTNFVEVMVPLFHESLFKECMETFSLNKSGWGIEYLWSQKCKNIPGDIAIFDDIEVFHTRAVSSAGSGMSKTESRNLPHHEANALFMHKAFNPRLDNICGISVNGTFLTLSDDDFHNALSDDAFACGLEKHPTHDKYGNYISAQNKYLSYCRSSLDNQIAIKSCQLSEEWINATMLCSLKASFIQVPNTLNNQ